MDVKQLDVLLIRHGTTAWNRDKRYLGHTDIGLDQGGREEMVLLARELAGTLFSKVYCSDLKRCRETLEILGPVSLHDIVYDSRLREMDFGAWEGLTYEDLKDTPLYREWIDSPQQADPPQGESWEHFEGRITEFTNSLLAEATKDLGKEEGLPSAPILVVTHGGVVRKLAVNLAAGLSFWDIHIKPGELLRLRLTLCGDVWTGAVLQP